MINAFYRIRDGHFHAVDMTAAKALERRGLVRIIRIYNVVGKEVPSARKYEVLVDGLLPYLPEK